MIGFIGALICVIFLYTNWGNFKDNDTGSLNVALLGFYILLFVLGVLIILAIGLWSYHGLAIKILKFKYADKELWDEHYKCLSLEQVENDLDIYFKAVGFLCGIIAFIIAAAIPSFIKLGGRLRTVHVIMQVVALVIMAIAVWSYITGTAMLFFRCEAGLEEIVSDKWLNMSGYLLLGIIIACLVIFFLAFR